MKVNDPNSNRMFCEDMGTCNDGCKCQIRWLVTWEDEEVVESEILTDYPCHLRNLSQELGNTFIEVERDIFKYAKTSNDWPYALFPDEKDNKLFYMETKEIDDVRYYKESCGSLDTMIWSYDYKIIEEFLNDKPNGYYVFDIEFACFTTYNYEYGEEGDSDYAAILLNEEPLTEGTIDNFLKELE